MDKITLMRFSGESRTDGGVEKERLPMYSELFNPNIGERL